MMLIDPLLGDARFAWRSLRRVPAFTVVTLVTLALGIASVTTILSFVYSYAFRPLPYPGADRIVGIQEQHPRAALASRDVSLG